MNNPEKSINIFNKRFGRGEDFAYLYSNRARHASCLTTSEPGRDFSFYTIMKRKYSNTAISINEQLSALRTQGLSIDIDNADFYLERINYFRLARYLSSLKYTNKDTGEKSYHRDAKFSDVLNLYYFDKDLRLLLFSLIQTIEVALRSKLINTFSPLDSHWFMESELFVNKGKFDANLVSLSKEINRSSEDFIKNYYNTYNEPALPPAWKSLEVLSLGQISKLYANFKDCAEKKEIARYFNLPNQKVLISWLKTISVLRNHCAHHSRIWNRTFGDLPQIPKKLKGEWIIHKPQNVQKLYLGLCCAKYMLNTIYADNNLTAQLQELFAKYPTVKIHPMGFTPSWDTEPLWR
ncbi:MAG: Abi family protein [Rikenellaceae bacterium]